MHCVVLCFVELTLNPPEGIVAGPINEENFFEWEALITLVLTPVLFNRDSTEPKGFASGVQRFR